MSKQQDLLDAFNKSKLRHNDFAKKNYKKFGFSTVAACRVYLSKSKKVLAERAVKSAAAKRKAEQHPFKKGVKYTYDQASDMLDVSVTKAKAWLKEARENGLSVVMHDEVFFISGEPEKAKARKIEAETNRKGFYRFGYVTDNHLGSKYERLDVLNRLYDIFAEEGITTVFNTGNWIDGEARFNMHDLKVHGFDAQIRYMIEQYPQREGIVTKYIAGDDHEGWYTQKHGIDAGRTLQERAQKLGRNDLEYLGYMENDVILPSKDGKGQTVIRLLHPGGGSAYAISYAPQKIVESYSGNEKPHVLLVGHYHKASYDFIRGVHVVQGGTTMDQSPFMRKKRLAAHLGGWIIEFSTLPNGAIDRFRAEFFPFYDKEFYKKWKYQQ